MGINYGVNRVRFLAPVCGLSQLVATAQRHHLAAPGDSRALRAAAVEHRALSELSEWPDV